MGGLKDGTITADGEHAHEFDDALDSILGHPDRPSEADLLGYQIIEIKAQLMGLELEVEKRISAGVPELEPIGARLRNLIKNYT